MLLLLFYKFIIITLYDIINYIYFIKI